MIRDAILEDIDKIIEIENSFINPYKKEDLIYELTKNKCSRFLVYEEDNIILGFIIFVITFDSASIIQIATRKDFLRKGVATKLLNESFNILKENKCEFYTLEVRASNEAAISLYEKNGFNKITTKPSYYKDGEDAYYYVKGMI